jgi:uncharacterized protein (TIGR01244 family)
MNLTHLSARVSVYGQVMPSDIQTLKSLGFSTLICNRPDHEDPGQPTAAEVKAAAEGAGLTFFFVPYNPSSPSPTLVSDFEAALKAAPEGKVLAFCRSGNRSARLWQAVGGP